MDTERISVTTNELIQALEEAASKGDSERNGAMRVCEISDLLGWSSARVRDHIRQQIEEGRMECVRVIIGDLQGRRMPVSAYRLVDKPEED